MKTETKKTEIKLGDLGDKLAIKVLRLLNESPNKKMSISGLITTLEKELSKFVSSQEQRDEIFQKYESSTAPKWVITMKFQTVKFVKAGFLDKEKRIWYLKPEGEKVLQFSDEDIINKAQESYKLWKEQRDESFQDDMSTSDSQYDDEEDITNNETEEEQASKDNKKARKEIQNYIYDSDVAPPGADGGVDVIAYLDPLGVKMPRLKVQVKHSKENIGVRVVRELQGLLTEGEIGVVVCNSGFAKEARKESRNMGKHMRLIGKEEFIDLWCKHYENMDENDKQILPLNIVHFLDKERITDR